MKAPPPQSDTGGHSTQRRSAERTKPSPISLRNEPGRLQTCWGEWKECAIFQNVSVVNLSFFCPVFFAVFLFPKRDGGMETTAVTFSSICYIWKNYTLEGTVFEHPHCIREPQHGVLKINTPPQNTHRCAHAHTRGILSVHQCTVTINWALGVRATAQTLKVNLWQKKKNEPRDFQLLFPSREGAWRWEWRWQDAGPPHCPIPRAPLPPHRCEWRPFELCSAQWPSC